MGLGTRAIIGNIPVVTYEETLNRMESMKQLGRLCFPQATIRVKSLVEEEMKEMVESYQKKLESLSKRYDEIRSSQGKSNGSYHFYIFSFFKIEFVVNFMSQMTYIPIFQDSRYNSLKTTTFKYFLKNIFQLLHELRSLKIPSQEDSVRDAGANIVELSKLKLREIEEYRALLEYLKYFFTFEIRNRRLFARHQEEQNMDTILESLKVISKMAEKEQNEELSKTFYRMIVVMFLRLSMHYWMKEKKIEEAFLFTSCSIQYLPKLNISMGMKWEQHYFENISMMFRRYGFLKESARILELSLEWHLDDERSSCKNTGNKCGLCMYSTEMISRRYVRSGNLEKAMIWAEKGFQLVTDDTKKWPLHQEEITFSKATFCYLQGIINYLDGKRSQAKKMFMKSMKVLKIRKGQTVQVVSKVDTVGLLKKSIKLCAGKEGDGKVMKKLWDLRYIKKKRLDKDREEVVMLSEKLAVFFVKRESEEEQEVGLEEYFDVMKQTKKMVRLVKNLKKSKSCHVCGRFDSRLKQCSNCRNVRYCSSRCQRKDWRKHKIECKKI